MGYLLAYEAGCERLIVMDDDNYPFEDDLIGWHIITGEKYAGVAVDINGGFYNYLKRAEYQSAIVPYPRGLQQNCRVHR